MTHAEVAASVDRCAELFERAHRNEVAALARLLTYVQAGGPEARAIAAALVGAQRRATVIGLTGAPGAGKSTLLSALITQLRAAGDRVAVVAVDPTSPFTGGAVLGDRVRMQEHTTDDGVFIRSFASRGQLGGLAAGVPQAVRLLDSVGFDTVIVETVGVGQSEVDIRWLVDTTILILAPGMGDAVQAVKAGIVEIADVYAVNKGDLPGADRLVRDMRDALHLGAAVEGAWQHRVVKVTATTGDGLPKLAAAVGEHQAWLAESGGDARRVARARVEVFGMCADRLRAQLAAPELSSALAVLAEAVANATTDPYAAADALFDLLDRPRA
jgi:LAO/AO transport system kinase